MIEEGVLIWGYNFSSLLISFIMKKPYEKLTKKTKLQMSNVTIMNRASFIYLNEEQTVNRARQPNLR